MASFLRPFVLVCLRFCLCAFSFFLSIFSRSVCSVVVKKKKHNQIHVAHRFAHIMWLLDNNRIYKNAYCSVFFFSSVFITIFLWMRVFLSLSELQLEKRSFVGDFSATNPILTITSQ